MTDGIVTGVLSFLRFGSVMIVPLCVESAPDVVFTYLALGMLATCGEVVAERAGLETLDDHIHGIAVVSDILLMIAMLAGMGIAAPRLLAVVVGAAAAVWAIAGLLKAMARKTRHARIEWYFGLLRHGLLKLIPLIAMTAIVWYGWQALVWPWWFLAAALVPAYATAFFTRLRRSFP